MKKILSLVLFALLSTAAVQAQDGKHQPRKESTKCDDKCKKECGEKGKEGKCCKKDASKKQ
jgi:hypothetical protein